jgi:tetratricopeptide (TPR) repeat protein
MFKIKIATLCSLVLLLGCWPWAQAQNLPAKEAGKEEIRKEFSRQLLWGRTLLEEGDYRGAYISLKQAVALDPEAASAWSLLGNTQFALGDREGAHQSWEKAKGKDPQWAALIDKKLNYSRRLNQIPLVFLEFHAQDFEGPSPLVVAFRQAFAERKITLKLTPFAESSKEAVSTYDVFASPLIDDYRQKFTDAFLMAVDAYSYRAALVAPSAEKESRSAEGVPGPAPESKGVAGKEEAGLPSPAYRLEALMRVKVYDLATGKVLAGYSRQQEAEGAPAEEALNNALKALGKEAGEEILRQLLDALTPRPDLVIKEEDLEIPNATVVKESAVELRLQIRNTGEEVAYNFDAVLYEGAPQEGKIIATFNIPSLWPDNMVTLEALWNPSALGYITLTALADAKKLVPESSLANNSASQKVYVISEAQLLSNLFEYAEKYQSSPADRQLLSLQKNLWAKPQDQEAARAFLKGALGREQRHLTVFGLGPRPLNLPKEATTSLLARRAAQVDAQRWLVLAWALVQGKNPQEVKPTVLRGASILGEQELPDGSYLVKMQVPLK